MDNASGRSITFCWLFAALASCAIAVLAIWWGAVNQDEGWYLYAAQCVRAGKFPYRDFFFTQGPALPFVYALLTPVWSSASPVSGLLGGRLVTLVFSLLATFVACLLVRRLVSAERYRGAASCAVFALLACNLYHVYFTSIPKTYALGSFFLLVGFWLLFSFRASFTLLAGIFFAFASGTRISLVLVLGVVGLLLLFHFRLFRWQFLWFGLGGVLGLFLTYGLFACDTSSRIGLFAAQQFHAARGGFDPFFAAGSVSRLARGYTPLGIVLFSSFLFSFCVGKPQGVRSQDSVGAEEEMQRARAFAQMLLFSFLAVFLLQLSAPFPYDDYQVPIMGLLSVLIVAFATNRLVSFFCSPAMWAWFVVLSSCLVSFASPLLQDWAAYGQDRFWSRKREMTALAKVRQVAREINAIDPQGTQILTQDAYLAIETGRTLPAGFELGPFAYYEKAPDAQAQAIHVLNRTAMTNLLTTCPMPVAAVSGYGFAISAPKMTEVDTAEQAYLRGLLDRRYECVRQIENFGQNATTLFLYRLRKNPVQR